MWLQWCIYTISVAATNTSAGNNNKEIVFKHCASSTECISEIKNTKIDNAKDIDVVVPIIVGKGGHTPLF